MISYEPFMQAISRKISLETRRKAYKRSVLGLVTILLSIYLLLGKVLAISVIRGDSMEPLLHNGDIALFSRIGDCKSGDVVILRVDKMDCVKRVIGRENDVIMINDSTGEVFINGMQEEYSTQDTYQRRNGIAFPITVPDGSVFVLGDNRTISRDSREYGSVDSAHLIGTLLWVLPLGSVYRSIQSIAYGYA